jgi:hypothetical protein
MEQFDTKIASLTYLTNPLYQQSINKQTKNTVSNNKSDIKFYRKRITALTKDMLKGEIPENNYIRSIYETYVNGLIKYFKMVDTSDIIQKQYAEGKEVAVVATEEANEVNEVNELDEVAADLTLDSIKLDTKKEITIHNMNDDLIRKYTTSATLDNFVIKQHNEAKDTRIIPIILDVDLKEPSLKTKGVKEKPKREKKQKEKI